MFDFEARYQEAVEALRGGDAEGAVRLLDDSLASPDLDVWQRPTCLTMLAVIADARQDHVESARRWGDTIAALEVLEPIVDTAALRAEAWSKRGSAFTAGGRLGEASDAWGRAADLFSRLAGEAVTSSRWRQKQAAALSLTGEHVAARRTYAAAMAVLDEVESGEGDIELARSLVGAAREDETLGRPDAAEELLRLGIGLLSSEGTVTTLPPLVAEQLWICCDSLATLLARTHRLNDAEPVAERAVSLLGQFDASRTQAASSLMHLGNIQRLRERFPAAERTYLRARAMVSQPTPETVDMRARIANGLGNCYRETGRWERAETVFREADDEARDADLPADPRAHLSYGRGAALLMLDRDTDAEEHFADALALYQRIPGTPREQADCLIILGGLYRRHGDLDAAEHFIRLGSETLESAGLHSAMAALGLAEIGMARAMRDGSTERLWGVFSRLLESVSSEDETVVRHLPEFLSTLARCLAAAASGLPSPDHDDDRARLTAQASDYATSAFLELHRTRHTLATENDRGIWGDRIARPAASTAFELAAASHDAVVIADLIAISRSSGALEARSSPLRRDLMHRIPPTDPRIAQRDTDDRTSPGLVAGSATASLLGLDDLFRRRPAPALQMPSGRVALARFTSPPPARIVRFV